MSTEPTTPITTEPPPAQRGEPINVPAPTLGRCIDGISEYGFIVCEADADGNAVIVSPAQPEPQPQPQPQVQMYDLPATGLDDVSAPVFGFGVIFASIGIFLIGVTRSRS
jgi:hypothetical protein